MPETDTCERGLGYVQFGSLRAFIGNFHAFGMLWQSPLITNNYANVRSERFQKPMPRENNRYFGIVASRIALPVGQRNEMRETIMMRA